MLLLLSGCLAGAPEPPPPADPQETAFLWSTSLGDPPPGPAAVIPAPLLDATDDPVRVDGAAVEAWLRLFVGEGAPYVERWFARCAERLPGLREQMVAAGLPPDLAVLPIVEAGCDREVGSRKGALGPWQFMPGTALELGLQPDDRTDWDKATPAAIGMLVGLHERFSDPAVALTAYNAGPSAVSAAIRTAGSDRWADVAPELEPEARWYAPKYVAIARIAAQR